MNGDPNLTKVSGRRFLKTKLGDVVQCPTTEHPSNYKKVLCT